MHSTNRSPNNWVATHRNLAECQFWENTRFLGTSSNRKWCIASPVPQTIIPSLKMQMFCQRSLSEAGSRQKDRNGISSNYIHIRIDAKEIITSVTYQTSASCVRQPAPQLPSRIQPMNYVDYRNILGMLRWRHALSRLIFWTVLNYVMSASLACISSSTSYMVAKANHDPKIIVVFSMKRTLSDAVRFFECNKW